MMNDQHSADPAQPGSTDPKRVNGIAETPGAFADDDANAPASGKPAVPAKLTPEEQMALYEEDLKESDWGHQPC